MYKTLVLSLLFITLIGCEWVGSPVSDRIDKKLFLLRDTVAVSYNQFLYNESESIGLHFSELVSDGRCPIDLHCFWEGNAEVKFVFEAYGIESKFSLNTYSGFTRDTTLSNYIISLIDLTPYPHSEKTHHPAQYQAYVVVSKNEWTL